MSCHRAPKRPRPPPHNAKVTEAASVSQRSVDVPDRAARVSRGARVAPHDAKATEAAPEHSDLPLHRGARCLTPVEHRARHCSATGQDAPPRSSTKLNTAAPRSKMQRAAARRPAMRFCKKPKRPARNNWDTTLTLLQRWRASNPGRAPSRGSTGLELRLARWLHNQREAFKAGILPAFKGDILNRMGLAGLQSWDDMLGEVKSWLEESPDDWPRQHVSDEGERRLANWINNQRKAHRCGNLSSEQVTKLEELPGWMWTFKDDQWNAAFDLLQEFYKVNAQFEGLQPQQRPSYPDEEAAAEWKAQEKRLAFWVTKQRHLHEQGKLSAHRVRRLESLPQWRWNVPPRNEQQQNDDWDTAFQDLHEWPSHRDFETGHELPYITKRVTPHERYLGRWVEKQVTQFRNAQAKRRRLRSKTRVPQRMLPERMRRMEEFLNNEGQWLSPAFRARVARKSPPLAQAAAASATLPLAPSSAPLQSELQGSVESSLGESALDEAESSVPMSGRRFPPKCGYCGGTHSSEDCLMAAPVPQNVSHPWSSSSARKA